MKSPRTLALVFLTLLVVGGTLWWWMSPTAFVTRVVALSGQEALVLSRHNGDNATLFWVSLQSTEGPRWVHRVDSKAQAVSGDALTASANRVSYLMLADGELLVVGLERSTGAVAWTTSLGEAEDRYLNTWLYAHAQVAGDLLLLPHGSVNGQLTALSLADGTIQWTEPLHSTTELLALDGTQQWILDGDERSLETLDLTSGERTIRSDSIYNHCFVQGALYAVRDDALVRTFPAESAPIPLPVQGARVHACGSFEGSLVVTLSIDQETVLVRVVEDAVVATLTLDWPHQMGGPNGRLAKLDRSAHALKGEMTRFLPLMFSAMDAEVDELRWVVVDLEDLTVFAEATPQRDYLYFDHVRAGTTHLFWYHGGLLIALDGESGQLAGAVRGARSFDARSFAEGVAWLPGHSWSAPSSPDLSWLRVDTLAPLGSVSEDSMSSALSDVEELTGWTTSSPPSN